jgi:putative membrane-bound dehydrogenase-like protein
MKRAISANAMRSVASMALLTGATTVVSAEVAAGGRTFVVPDGFEVELVAGPPLVDRPIVADFDERGRLYVADSSGSNDKVQEQLEKRPHRIVRLEDSDGDGRFDRRTVFADRMMFPEGTMWLDGSLYVAAPPSIWKLTDTDGDGVADRREEWFQGKTITGCANDLHGPYRGPDGWIYWCKGAFAEQTYERPGKPPLVTRAAHIFRCRPDGTGIEPVMTGGMDNPVDVVFTPGGERVFTTTFLQLPAAGRRDGLIHAVYGGIYGKVNDAVEGHKRTGPDLMPVLAHLGPAAPCGLTRYESGAFGDAYRDNLFACCFNLHKVTRHVLTPDGATFASRDEDFLATKDDLDFHPTDVIEDADGSLLVVDTGGWYKLCCPTSQLHKPDVLGAIYRVRRKGMPEVSDARGERLKEAIKDLHSAPVAETSIRMLGSPAPAVRRLVMEEISRPERREVALPLLRKVATPDQSPALRRNVAWTLTRIDHPDAFALVRDLLADPDETVRQVALHSIGLRRDREAMPALIGMLRNPSVQNRRAAAEALGRIGDPSAVPALLDALAGTSDRVLVHSLTFALIEIADPRATAAGLASAAASARRAALIALDQMDGGDLKPEAVAPLLSSPDPATKETALWVVGRHPEWGDALAGVLRERLAAEDFEALSRFAHVPAVQDLLADRVRDDAAPRDARAAVLRSMSRAGLRQMPKSWVAALAHALASGGGELVRLAVATARALPAPRAKEDAAALGEALRRVAADATAPDDVRLGAMAAVPGGLGRVDPALFALLRAQLDPDRPALARAGAADVLSKAKLEPEQLGSLADAIKAAGPLELDRLLSAFAQTTDEGVGLKVVAALKGSPALPSLRSEALRPHLAKFGDRVRREAEGLYATLAAEEAGQKARLEELVSSLSGGDIRRGQAVFNGAKAACSSCHAIGYLGGKVGPDLTKIGQVRAERDLLEAIAFPSASFVRSYEPVVVATRDGKVFNGVLRNDTAAEVVLATGATEEARIARDDIEEMRPGTVSVMPAGLDRQLSAQELADLVAFLKACR